MTIADEDRGPDTKREKITWMGSQCIGDARFVSPV